MPGWLITPTLSSFRGFNGFQRKDVDEIGKGPVSGAGRGGTERKSCSTEYLQGVSGVEDGVESASGASAFGNVADRSVFDQRQSYSQYMVHPIYFSVD